MVANAEAESGTTPTMAFRKRLTGIVGAVALAGALAFSAGASAQTSPWQQSFTHEAAGRYAEAAAALEPVLRDKPNHEFALLRRAWLNYLQGRHNEAIRDYNQALTLNFKSLDARHGVTLPLMAQQRWTEAALEARKAINAGTDWDYTGHLHLMISEEGARKWEDLAEHAAQASLRYPGDATFLVYQARAHAWMANVARAKAVYGQVLERVPAHIEALEYIKTH